MRDTKKAPTVSVIIPSYNHDKFVQECLESVLNQSFQDFEIVITDDGSKDDTVGVIKTFNDPRIKLFSHSQNKGACVAANNCLAHSRGRFIAMLSSDDAWYPDKLAKQVEYLDNHPEFAAVFGKVDWIDEDGNLIEDDGFRFRDVFDVHNRTRFEWLAQFFNSGNKLCHPSSLVRRECYDVIGRFNPSLANLPDLDLWIRLCFRYEIHIMDEKFVRFRLLREAKNVSADNLSTRIRARFEYKQLLDHYLQIQDPRNLLKIFPDADRYGKVSSDLMPYFLGRFAIDSGQEFIVLWGLETIYNLIQNERIARKLEKSCGFTYLDLIKLTGKHDPFGVSQFNAIPAPPVKEAVSDPIIIVRRSRSFLIASKTYVRNILAAFKALLAASKNYAGDVYSIFSRSGRNRTHQLPAPTGEIRFSINELESMSGDDGVYRLSGWAFLEKDSEQSAYERMLVLKSGTRTFLYPLTSFKNPNTQKGDEGMINSGFAVVLSRSVMRPDIYTVGILFRHPSNAGSYHTHTDKILIYSAGQLRLESADVTHKPQTSRGRNLIATVKTHLKDVFRSES